MTHAADTRDPGTELPRCKLAPAEQRSPCEGDPEHEWLPADDGSGARLCPVHWVEKSMGRPGWFSWETPENA